MLHLSALVDFRKVLPFEQRIKEEQDQFSFEQLGNLKFESRQFAYDCLDILQDSFLKLQDSVPERIPDILGINVHATRGNILRDMPDILFTQTSVMINIPNERQSFVDILEKQDVEKVFNSIGIRAGSLNEFLKKEQLESCKVEFGNPYYNTSSEWTMYIHCYPNNLSPDCAFRAGNNTY